MFPQPGAGERSTVDNYTRMAELTEEKAQLDTGFWVRWNLHLVWVGSPPSTPVNIVVNGLVV